MSCWTGKPCVGCDRRKGPKHADLKYCHRCRPAVKKANQDLQHRRKVAKLYGINVDDQVALLELQGERCPICLRATGRTRRLSLDHDHVTLEPRGFLCGLCNDMLGHARDSIDFFRRAIDYLTDPPARRIRSVRVESARPPAEAAVEPRTDGSGG